MRSRGLMALILIIVLIVSAVIGMYFYYLVTRPMLDKTQSPVVVRLNHSMTAHAFARHLKEQELIQSERLFVFLVRVQGAASRLQAGVYLIHPGELAWQLIQRVVAGDVMRCAFQVVEGTTHALVADNLHHAPYLLASPQDWQSIQAQYPHAEGLLLAETYQYDAGSSAQSLLLRAHQHLLSALNDAWESRDPELPYQSPYELLIAASIIEKETAITDERYLVSSVVVNRLRKGMPLQMDPTVIYALGTRYTGKLTKQDLRVDSPYNTYRYRGLPPTPIAMVGREAIDAAAHPAKTAYLYFVAKGDGKHQFSVNYEAQKKAVRAFRQRSQSMKESHE